MKELPKWIEQAAEKARVAYFDGDDPRDIRSAFLAGARAVLERVEGTKDDDFNSSLKHIEPFKMSFEMRDHCQQSFQDGRESVRKEVLE